MNKNSNDILKYIVTHIPEANAAIKGSKAYPNLWGDAKFYSSPAGIIIATEAFGLPCKSIPCENAIFAMHIHEGKSCTGNDKDPFADAKAHYNPEDCLHPQHAGDLPPLFCSDGYALSVFMTGRFKLNDIIGRTVIIHRMPDDFMTQPSGNSGEKIACGVIRKRQ